MAKCTIEILLDSPERVYRGGDLVTGVVRLITHENISCDQIRLKAGWLTRGRGNRDSGSYHVQSLHQGPLEANREYQFRFTYEIPHWPLTYRGRILNVEHEIEVRVYIPWAFDPKQTLDYVVLPAPSTPAEVRFPPAKQTTSGTVNPITLAAALIMFVVGVMLIPAFGIGLFVIAFACWLLFHAFRKWAAEQRLGVVKVQLDEPIVTKGRAAVPRIEFVPTWTGTINAIHATLTCKEVCVSGSGTNRRTHTEVLHSEKQACHGPRDLRQGQLTQYHSRFEIPPIDAFSFEGNNNRLIWQIDVHIDIPNWPDWVHAVAFTFVPTEHLSAPPIHPVLLAESAGDTQMEVAEPMLAAIPVMENATPAADAPMATKANDRQTPDSLEAVVIDSLESSLNNPETSLVENTASDSRESLESDGSLDQPSHSLSDGTEQQIDERAQSSSESASNSESAPLPSSAHNIHEVFEKFAAARSYGGEVDELIESFHGEKFDFTIDVDRVTSTIGSYDEPSYANGKTVTGRLADSKARIEVECPETMNDQVSPLRTNDQWDSTGTVVSWDPLFQRLKMRCQ